MSQPRYILKKGGKKQLCPQCGKKTFVPFIDTTSGDELHSNYGRCDREVNCAYFSSPYKDGYNKSLTFNYGTPRYFKQSPKRLSIVQVELLKQSRNAYDKNNFVQWLKLIFGTAITNDLISRYQIGTSKHWPGSTIFWQIDNLARVRSGKVMLYNPATGRRAKSERYNYINWVHSILKLKDFELRQCLFGEHLLNQQPASPIAIVESEKTAIVASVYLPRFLWLAVGSLNNLSAEKCNVLAGRKVYLFPDLNAFAKWKEKTDQLSALMPGTSFVISDYLQANATEEDKYKGLDLADYLIRFCPGDFINVSLKNDIKSTIKPNNEPKAACEKSENCEAVVKNFNPLILTPFIVNSEPFSKQYIPIWDTIQLEDYFKGLQLPIRPLRVNKSFTINNVQIYINSHIEILKHNNGNLTFAPFYGRLIELKEWLKKDKTV